MSAQHLTNTAPNRYPDVFRTLRARIAETRGPDLGQGELRILSFGCSVGFEMRTLRAYFPDASIFGCDTSLDALNRARRNLREDPGIVFFSTPEAIRAFAPFDIVLAMSVLCQFPASTRADSLERVFPHGLFAHLTGTLVESLRPGGLLCLVNANYLFSGLEEARAFRPVRSPLIHSNGFVDKFGRDGKRLTRIYRDKGLFSHRAVADGIADDDLRDCIFEKAADGTSPIAVPFLDTRPPPGVAFGAPVIAEGVDATAATRDGTIAAHREEAFGRDAEGRLWMRAEWRKSTLAGEVTGFGAWYGIAGSERAGTFTSAQSAALAHTRERMSRKAILLERVRGWLPGRG